MAHFKTLLFLSLLFTVVLVFSSKASAGNEPGDAQTQGGAQVDYHHGGGGYGGGRGGGYGGGRGGGHCPHCREDAGGDETKSGEIESTNHKP